MLATLNDSLGWMERKSSNIYKRTKEFTSNWSVNTGDFFEGSI